MDAASYYADLTSQYRHYGGEPQGWHYGIWDTDVNSHEQALLRSNERLLAGLPIGPGTRVLDVGFGGGGFSVWAARTTGADVTGITVCEAHVALAAERATRHGVADRCRFLYMDMNELAFPAGHFDVVVNQETACYAANKAAYLGWVFRVLRPGGVWRALDFSVQEDSLSWRQRQDYEAVCDGFHMPSMASLSQIRSAMTRAGFDVEDAVDVTAAVLPTARMIRRQCYLPRSMSRLGLDWLIYSRDPVRRRNRRGHILAALRYSQGLERGVFRYTYYSARRPDAPASRGVSADMDTSMPAGS